MPERRYCMHSTDIFEDIAAANRRIRQLKKDFQHEIQQLKERIAALEAEKGGDT